jgi:hypothetical protein
MIVLGARAGALPPALTGIGFIIIYRFVFIWKTPGKKFIMARQTTNNDFFDRTPFLHAPEWVPVAKWVRVKFGNEFVAGSRRVMLRRKVSHGLLFSP